MSLGVKGLISQFHNHAQSLKVTNSGGPLDNQTWQTEWKTAPLAKVQLCEYENQTLEAFVADSRLSAKFDCPVAHQSFSLLSTAQDRETGFLCEIFYGKKTGRPLVTNLRTLVTKAELLVILAIHWLHFHTLYMALL